MWHHAISSWRSPLEAGFTNAHRASRIAHRASRIAHRARLLTIGTS
jgi:hypothetical protein